MMLLIYSGVIYNERASIEYLQSLLNELEITIGTTTADDKIGIFDSTGSETELKQKENLKVSSNSFETKGLYFFVSSSLFYFCAVFHFSCIFLLK